MTNQKGFYSYVKEKTNIKTHYVIEFTRDKKIYDIMDTTEFDFSMLNRLEFDYLEDAINTYNVLYYDELILHVMMFEEVILNGKTVLEQSKSMTAQNILPQKIKQDIDRLESHNKVLQEENELFKEYLKMFNMNIYDLKKQLEKHKTA